jgi:hypothetical protein
MGVVAHDCLDIMETKRQDKHHEFLVEALTALDLAVGSKETQPGQRIKAIN